jgi:hypothetical protein
MFINNSNVPINSKIKIIKNIIDTTFCQDFVGLIGTATYPFRRGCCKEGWIGVIFDEETEYGKKLNFHIDEIEIIEFSTLTII